MISTTVTLDTNVLPADDITAVLAQKGFSFAVVSVSDRELGGSPLNLTLKNMGSVAETAVWGESRWGEAKWAGPDDSDCFERALAIIGAGSFPPPVQRQALSDGQRRQLRDAMIFCAHVREARDIFVSNDLKAFVHDGRREKLQAEFSTRIMTRQEFIDEFCTNNPIA